MCPILGHIWGKSDPPPGYPVGVGVSKKDHLGSGKMGHPNLDEKNGCWKFLPAISCNQKDIGAEFNHLHITPPLWTDLVKMTSRKLRHASSFSFERTDFKNVIFENIPWAHSEDAEVDQAEKNEL